MLGNMLDIGSLRSLASDSIYDGLARYRVAQIVKREYEADMVGRDCQGIYSVLEHSGSILNVLLMFNILQGNGLYVLRWLSFLIFSYFS